MSSVVGRDRYKKKKKTLNRLCKLNMRTEVAHAAGVVRGKHHETVEAPVSFEHEEWKCFSFLRD